uniref:Uncharacterized protein n=1 Tax=Anguilla anguilla TaxID=7936 RepID=A0A0E9V701_ANGAN
MPASGNCEMPVSKWEVNVLDTLSEAEEHNNHCWQLIRYANEFQINYSRRVPLF